MSHCARHSRFVTESAWTVDHSFAIKDAARTGTVFERRCHVPVGLDNASPLEWGWKKGPITAPTAYPLVGCSLFRALPTQAGMSSTARDVTGMHRVTIFM